jgi:hypothetical protein
MTTVVPNIAAGRTIDSPRVRGKRKNMNEPAGCAARTCAGHFSERGHDWTMKIFKRPHC